MKSYTVTREQLKTIYPNVCGDWQRIIKNIIDTADTPFNETFSVPEVLLTLARRELTTADQKEWLDKVFGYENIKLVIGKWYNYKSCLLNYQGLNGLTIKAYGFVRDIWIDSAICRSAPEEWEEATDKEVEEALTKEAIKRGFKSGVTFESISVKGSIVTSKEISHYKLDGSQLQLHHIDCIIDGRGVRGKGWIPIFRHDKWAEIIKPKLEVGDYIQRSTPSIVSFTKVRGETGGTVPDGATKVEDQKVIDYLNTVLKD